LLSLVFGVYLLYDYKGGNERWLTKKSKYYSEEEKEAYRGLSSANRTGAWIGFVVCLLLALYSTLCLISR